MHYSAPDGEHDDCVCALALAVRQQARRFGSALYLITPGGDTTEDEAVERQRYADALRERVLRNGGCWMPGDGWWTTRDEGGS